MSQNKFGIKTVVHKKLFLELTKKYGIEPLSAMKTVDSLELEKDNTFKINDVRNTTKRRGGLTITVYKKIIIPNTGQPYEKEVKKLKTHPDGKPGRLEFYDSMPGLPDRAGGQKPALVEWWPSGDKKKEVFYKNNVKHRDGGPAEISYDQWGEPTEQKFYTMGVPQERLDAGRKQEIEFNQKRDEKAWADEQARQAKMKKRHDDLGVTNLEIPSAKPKEPPVLDKSWMDQSGDSRIDVDLDNDDSMLLNPEPTGPILNQKSDQKPLDLFGSEPKPEESPDLEPEQLVTDPQIPPEVMQKMRDHFNSLAKKPEAAVSSFAPQPQIKDKSLYSKIIGNISKFLAKKHKEKLSPEVLKKIEDYYTTRVAPTKKTAPVQDQFKKEYTGRKREEFPIGAVKKPMKNESKNIDSDISESIINEAMELTEELIQKYKEKLF